MNTHRCRYGGILYFLLSTQIIVQTSSLDSQSVETYDKWANSLKQSLAKLRDLSGADLLENAYGTAQFDKKEITEEIAFNLLDKALEKIDQIVKLKSRFVQNIKAAAEEAYRTKSKVVPEKCYYRAKAINLRPTLITENVTQNCSEKLFLDLDKNPLYDNKYVSVNFSVAHVPTNVYDLSTSLVDVGNWTKALNPVFIANAKEDPTLKWQYFCSSTGFFRYYPGAMWDIQLDENRLDFFDCRSQLWYLSASSYAKEMIILVDKSGSMKGRSDIISNATVSEILNTLTENDFFNIIMFSDTPKYVDSEVDNRLLQAFDYNKDHMIKRFKNFAPNGTASFERALIEAFTLLNNTQDSAPTRHCNRMLMVITDSVPGSYKELFDQYNPDKSVRVFVYLLGQHSSAEPYVEELACYNRGYAVTITTLADVKENVLKYLDVVARSNVLHNHSYTIWSGVTAPQLDLRELNAGNFTKPYVPLYSGKMYIPGVYPFQEYKQYFSGVETLIAAKEHVPPLFTSVAEAVFDKTPKSIRQKKGNLLGVAGTDVPLQAFKDTLRGWEVGVNNYLFAVDNNGFILFHPNYKPTHNSILKNYYQNVDVNEVEIPDQIRKELDRAGLNYKSPLREKLLSGKRGVSTLQTQTVTDNRHMIFRTTRRYFTDVIPNTPFTLGLAMEWNQETGSGYPIPDYRVQTGPINFNERNMRWFAPVYAENSANCPTLMNDTLDGATLVPYRFCKFSEKLAGIHLINPICALQKILLDAKLQETQECDLAYLKRLVLEAERTHKLLEHWNQRAVSSTVSELGVQQAFSFHHGGLIRYHNFSTLAYANFLQDHINGVEDPLYVATVLTTRYFNHEKIMVFHPPPNDLYRQYNNEQIPVPTIVTTAVLRNLGHIPMAVSGLQITHKKLTEIVDREWGHCGAKECAMCGNASVTCYLINQAAVILHSSGGDKEVGRNLKEVDCGLVEILVNHSVLTQRDFYDFQSVCIETSHLIQSAGARIFWPLHFITNLLVMVIREITIFWFILIEQLNARFINGQSWKDPRTDDILQFQSSYRGSDDNNNYHKSSVNEFGQGAYTNGKYSTLNLKPTANVEKQSVDETMNVNIPPLPPLSEGETTTRASNPANVDDQSTQGSSDTNIYAEDLIAKQEQDSYEMQMKALEDIERCREKESLSIQTYIKQETEENFTEAYSVQDKRNMSAIKSLVPGNLVSCVHKAVQQRCRLGSSTSSYTGRYACEIVCGLIRERMPHMAYKLDECIQPLVPCTEKFETFQIVQESFGAKDSWRQNSGPQTNARSGVEYNTACGTRNWWIKRIEGTNLYLLVDSTSGDHPVSCKNQCRRPYRYGKRIYESSTKTKVPMPRRDPPIPDTCAMVNAEMEDADACTSGIVKQTMNPVCVWISLMILHYTENLYN